MYKKCHVWISVIVSQCHDTMHCGMHITHLYINSKISEPTNKFFEIPRLYDTYVDVKHTFVAFSRQKNLGMKWVGICQIPHLPCILMQFASTVHYRSLFLKYSSSKIQNQLCQKILNGQVDPFFKIYNSLSVYKFTFTHNWIITWYSSKNDY